jgi:hypothetical protein
MGVMCLASETRLVLFGQGKIVCPQAKKQQQGGPAEAHNVTHRQWFLQVCSRNFECAYPEGYRTYVYVMVTTLQAGAVRTLLALLDIAVHDR